MRTGGTYCCGSGVLAVLLVLVSVLDLDLYIVGSFVILITEEIFFVTVTAVVAAVFASTIRKESVCSVCGGGNSKSNAYGNGDNLTVPGFFGFSEKAHGFNPPWFVPSSRL